MTTKLSYIINAAVYYIDFSDSFIIKNKNEIM